LPTVFFCLLLPVPVEYVNVRRPNTGTLAMTEYVKPNDPADSSISRQNPGHNTSCETTIPSAVVRFEFCFLLSPQSKLND